MLPNFLRLLAQSSHWQIVEQVEDRFRDQLEILVVEMLQDSEQSSSDTIK